MACAHWVHLVCMLYNFCNAVEQRHLQISIWAYRDVECEDEPAHLRCLMMAFLAGTQC